MKVTKSYQRFWEVQGPEVSVVFFRAVVLKPLRLEGFRGVSEQPTSGTRIAQQGIKPVLGKRRSKDRKPWTTLEA